MPVDRVSSKTPSTVEKTRDPSRSKSNRLSTSSQQPGEDDFKKDPKASSSRHTSSRDADGTRRRESSSVRSRPKVVTTEGGNVGDSPGAKLASRSLVQAEKESSRRRESSSSRVRTKATTEGMKTSRPGVEPRKSDDKGAAKRRDPAASTTTPLKALRKSVAASGDQVSPSQRNEASTARRQTVTSDRKRPSIPKDSTTTASRNPKPSRPEDRSKMADTTSGSQRPDEKLRTKRRPEETSRTKVRTSTSDLGRPSRSKPAEVTKSKPTAQRQGERAVEQPREGGRKRTSTRVLSPSEVKMADLVPHVDSAALLGPSTSGLLGPSTSGLLGAGDTSAGVFGDVVSTDDGEEYEYEDDFEDYESDFEDDSSDDSAVDDVAAAGGTTTSAGELRAQGDEKKMDSGNYDMADSRRRSQQVRELQEAMERENADLAERQRRQKYIEKEAPTSLVDEGFEEERNEDWRGSVPKEIKFINFENARKRQKEMKVAERAKRRGEELLSMIRLDVMKYKLFELKPVAYDVYMRNYGRANTAQAHVQTNEDNLSEEVQTDQVFTKDMWTQKPPAFQVGATPSTLQQDRLGVGGPTCSEDDMNAEHVDVDPDKLDTFMSRVGPTVLRMLAEDRMSNNLQLCTAKMRFSRGFVSLGTESVPFLAHRPVSLVRFAPGQPSTLLTVHRRAEGEEASADQDARASRCAICVWDLLNPSSPTRILAARFEATAACFDSARASLVIAGLEDGALCVWDLREKAVAHQEVTENDQWLLRSPTYSTAEVMRRDGHLSPVVALQPLIEKQVVGTNDYSPTQLCSLESAGVVIVWTVIQSFERGLSSGASDQDLGLAPWGRVRLVRSAVIALEDSLPTDQMFRANLECLDLQLLSEDTNHLFISTNSGHVVHCLKIGGKPSPRLYSQQSGTATSATCIEACPFGLPIFLVGCGDGSLRMHRREKERPLSTMEGTADAEGEGPPIVTLQWSRSKPTVFFVLDATSRIHVWDLSRSDLSPQYSVDLTDREVTAIQLAPDLKNGKTRAQMVIATKRGTVEVHQLKEEYSHRSRAEEIKELGRFRQFTDRL